MLQSTSVFYKILKKFTNFTVNLCKIYYNNEEKMYYYFHFKIKMQKTVMVF